MRISQNLYRVSTFLGNLFFATVAGIVLGTLLFIAVDFTESVTFEIHEQNRAESRIRFFYDMEQARNSCRDHLFGTLSDYNGYKEVYVCAWLDKDLEPAE